MIIRIPLAIPKLVGCGVLAVWLAGIGGRAHADEILQKARDLRYSQPEEGLLLLERAVKVSPHNTSYWVELVSALGNHYEYFAERASRTALKLNPGNPDLLIARARIVPPAVAYGLLNELAEVPGREEQAGRYRELISLGLGIPENSASALPYEEWIKRLLAAGKPVRAQAIIDEALAKKTDTRRWLAYRAIALALQGNFEDSLRVQELAGFPQVEWGSYEGLADYLAIIGNFDQALLSFNNLPPAEKKLRRIYAYACFKTGKREQARELLSSDDHIDQVLLLSFCLDSGDKDEVNRAAKLIEDSMSKGGMSAYVPLCSILLSEAYCLQKEFRIACQWVAAHYPANSAMGIELHPTDKLEHEEPMATALPAWKLMAKLNALLERPHQSRQEEALRSSVSAAYADEHGYDKAAEVIAGQAIAVSRLKDDGYLHDRDAVQWSILKRRADAEKLFRTDPETLVTAREILANIKNGRELQSIIDGKSVPAMAEDSQKLIALGPGVLSSVFDEFEPNTLGAVDRLPLIAVIKELGKPQDVPVLLHAWRIMAKYLEEKEQGKEALDDFQTAFVKSYESQDKAINDCLTAITGKPAPAGTRRERLNYWMQWWNQNASTIITTSK